MLAPIVINCRLEPASNAVHGSENVELFRTEKEVFFPETLSRKPPATTAKIENSTLCVIKPHAVAEGKLGYIISAIVNSPKFKITALQMLHLTTPNADEFLEVSNTLLFSLRFQYLCFKITGV